MLEIKINGSTVAIPSWMNSLQQNEVDQLLLTNNKSLVFSCGTSPKDGLVSLITLDLNVYSFNPIKYDVHQGDFVPSSDGQKIFMPNGPNRWPKQISGFFLPAEWILKRSTLELDGAKLELNNSYVGEFIAKNS